MERVLIFVEIRKIDIVFDRNVQIPMFADPGLCKPSPC